MKALSLIILFLFEFVFAWANFDKKDKTELAVAKILFIVMLVPIVYIINN